MLRLMGLGLGLALGLGLGLGLGLEIWFCDSVPTRSNGQSTVINCFLDLEGLGL